MCRVCSLFCSFIFFATLAEKLSPAADGLKSCKKERKASRTEHIRNYQTSNGEQSTTSFMFSANKFDWFRAQRARNGGDEWWRSKYSVGHRLTGTDQDGINLAEKLQSDQSRSNYWVGFDRLPLYSTHANRLGRRSPINRVWMECAAIVQRRKSAIIYSPCSRGNEWHSRSAVFTCAPDIPMAMLHNARRARTSLVRVCWLVGCESIVSVLCMHVCECARASSSDSMIFLRFCSFILHVIIVIVHTILHKNRKRPQKKRHVVTRNGNAHDAEPNCGGIASTCEPITFIYPTRVSRVRLLHRAANRAHVNL